MVHYVAYGTNENIIEQLVNLHKITHIAYNKDFTPYATKRDNAIKKVVNKLNIEVMRRLYTSCLNLEYPIILTIIQCIIYHFTILHRDSDSIKIKKLKHEIIN